MEIGETGMNPVAVTIVNPRKEYWLRRGSKQRPRVLKSCMLPTKLYTGSTHKPQELSIVRDSFEYEDTREITVSKDTTLRFKTDCKRAFSCKML